MFDVKEYLQHRYPFLFIDGVLKVEKDKSIRAYKNVSHNEQVFSGHFPDNPIFPGVLTVEAMAQAACVLMVYSSGVNLDEISTYLTGIEKVRFKKVIVPGDKIIFEVAIENSRGDFYKFTGKAFVNDELACSASFSAGVIKFSNKEANKY